MLRHFSNDENYFVYVCFIQVVLSVLLGICESIIAAALSRIGWRVLHLDRLVIKNFVLLPVSL